MDPEAVARKRDFITRVCNRSEGLRKTITEFTNEERLELFREAYSRHVNNRRDTIDTFRDSSFKTLPEFIAHREKVVEALVARLHLSRGDEPGIKLMMLEL